MKKTLLTQLALISMVLVVAGLTAPPAEAACAAPTPVFHGLDGYFACPDSGAHGAFAYQLTDPTAPHSGTADILCETLGEGCFYPARGPVGDGRATIETDKGEIVMDLDANTAPLTVNNFALLADLGFYDWHGDCDWQTKSRALKGTISLFF